jgi:F-type H+-transporting ATPase subunit delta
MSASPTAEGYAAAFFEMAKAEGVLNTVGNELASFSQTFESSPELQQRLTDQFLPVERRQSTIVDLLGGKANPTTVNLISTLVGAGRAKELPAVVQQLLSRTAAASGQESGEVRSAIALTEDQQQRLTAAVAKSTGRAVALTFVVDPSLLGGVVTRIGDTVIDGSVKNRLDQLKAAV